ncbi:fluoride efflux transporter CrcB [Virgibacillus sediminis]|uniref:Fluoride-specific ion channel FluC n=1 Tax=Virgibacillus sediminis TaxID=202260 RepID=A0ABV7AA92_9BACI
MVWVMAGGFLGSMIRYFLGEWVHAGGGFPLGTFLINLSGCFLLGWFMTASVKKKVQQKYIWMIGTGFLGSFTTFSTFSVETVGLIEDGAIGTAVLYVGLSIILGMLLAYAGFRLEVGKGADSE